MATLYSYVTCQQLDWAEPRSSSHVGEVPEIDGTLDEVRAVLKVSKLKIILQYPAELRVQLAYIYVSKEGVICI